MSSSKKAQPLSDSEDDSDVDRTDRGRQPMEKISNPLKRRPERVPASKRFAGGLRIQSTGTDDDSNATMSLSAAEKKGLKEVEDLERELDLKNTFSRETNKRDEDAEMNKYINEKMKLKLEADELRQSDKSKATSSELPFLSDMFTMSSEGVEKIDDILLQSLAKHEVTKHDEKSEAMLSSQMLNGVPEVELDGTRMKSNRQYSSRRK